MANDVTWLASYPRSGNTLLRMILFYCFGLRSGSVYRNDLGGNTDLETYVGHIEHDASGAIPFPPGAPHLVKTHGYPRDKSRTIYVVRDGRAACVSLWEFYGRRMPLESVISGDHYFGTWANHLVAWEPWSRKRTLFLRYEDLLNDLPNALGKIRKFLGAEVLNENIPERDVIAKVDGRWVTKKSDWRVFMGKREMDLFYQVNGAMMNKLSYDVLRA